MGMVAGIVGILAFAGFELRHYLVKRHLAKVRCPACGGNATEHNLLEDCQYVDGTAIREITVTVPTGQCREPKCGYQWTDHRAESIRGEAIKKEQIKRGNETPA